MVAPDLQKGLTVACDGRTVSITGQWTVSAPALGGFPTNWRSVLPKKKPALKGSPAFLGLHQVEDFCKAGQLLNRAGEVQFYQDAETPVLVFYPNSPELFGVLMPRRAEPFPDGKAKGFERAPFAIPNWLANS